MLYILIYLLSIYILYVIIFYKLVFPIKQKTLLIFLNNCELRGGGGFITHHIEVYLFLGIPYKFKKIPFEDINSYTIESFEPFKNKLSKKLSFRDCNFSIFNEQNYNRLIEFYTKSLTKEKRPDNILLLNFSFIEDVFPNINIKFNGFIFNKKNLFRNLSHIVTDNNGGKYGRKEIINKLGIKLIIIILLIPFYIHIILIKSIKNIRNKNLFILNSKTKDTPNGNYLGIEENNIIGRKGNRYLSNYTEYNLYIEELKGEYIYGKGMLKIIKTLFVDDSFPISGNYKASIKGIFSQNFHFEDKREMIEIKNGETIIYEIPFTFKLPKKGEINIIKGPGTINNNISINFQTKIFYLLPKTNLQNKKDHLNSNNFELKKDFTLKYDILLDKSPLKLLNSKIIEDGLIIIHFQKELINFKKDNFTISYKGKNILVEKITKRGKLKEKIILHYKKGSIGSYDFKVDKNLAYIDLLHLEDKTGMFHYSQGRKIRIIW